MSETNSQTFAPLFDPNELIDLKSQVGFQFKEQRSSENDHSNLNLGSFAGELPESKGHQQDELRERESRKTEDGREGDFKEDDRQSEHSKIDPRGSFVSKDEGKVNQLPPVKPETQIWPGSNWQNQLPRRYKIRVQKTDLTSLRHECFCSRQYLSYCALYQHMVRSHPDFLQNNKRFSSTNVIEAVDPVYGFRIKKVTRHRKKRQENNTFTPGDNLTLRTKRRIREQSPQIQKWLREVQSLELLKEHNSRKLKIYEKKEEKLQEAILNFNEMIKSYQKILKILNIRPIVNAMDNKNPLPKLKRKKSNKK